MKKTVVLSSVIITVIAFSYCSPAKKAVASKPVLVTYEANMVPLLATNCTPCHFPDKGGRKKPLDTYNAVIAQVDDALRRIQLNPTGRGFMPDRHPKLSDSTISVFKKWKADGLLAK